MNKLCDKSITIPSTTIQIIKIVLTVSKHTWYELYFLHTSGPEQLEN